MAQLNRVRVRCDRPVVECFQLAHELLNIDISCAATMKRQYNVALSWSCDHETVSCRSHCRVTMKLYLTSEAVKVSEWSEPTVRSDRHSTNTSHLRLRSFLNNDVLPRRDTQIDGTAWSSNVERNVVMLCDNCNLICSNLVGSIAISCHSVTAANILIDTTRNSSAVEQISKCYRLKGKGKGLDTCYSATYMSQTSDQQRFTILEVAADWHEPMVPQHIMWPSIARANGQLDPQCS